MTNEWTKEIETLRARNAALEAACKSVAASAPKPKYDNPEDAHEGGRDDDAVSAAWMDLASWNTAAPARDALRGGTSALDAVVSAAVAESRARTFRAAITYVTGDLRTPHPDADAEAKAFAAAVRERIAAAVAAERAAIRAAAKATPAAKPVDTEDALRRERTEALDTLAEINNIAAHALDIATIHNPGPGFVKAHVERLAKEHRALRTAKPVVPVKFDASHAARGDGWHARAYNDGYISIGIQLRPGEDAGETVAKMLAACGRGL